MLKSIYTIGDLLKSNDVALESLQVEISSN